MAKDKAFTLADGEVVLADTTSPLSNLIFPLLELVVITGLAWMAIGWMDVNGVPTLLRNLLVGLWAILGVTRFIFPLITSRRRRFLVTDRRVLARSRRGAVDSVPYEQIHSARRQKGGLMVAVYGFEQPLYFPDVGRLRKVEKLIHGQLSHTHRF